MLERCRSDLSAALRSLSRFPSLVVGPVLTLAVSGGLNVAVFGLMDRALLSPPAQVAEPARVFGGLVVVQVAMSVILLVDSVRCD